MEVRNKTVHNNYEISDRIEAGIVLFGPEVKACKKGSVNFKGSYVSFQGNDCCVFNIYIGPYAPAKREQKIYNPYRPRKLLLNTREREILKNKLNDRGMTVIPLRIYTKHRFIKLELALAKGLKRYDKRERIKEREFKKRKARLTRHGTSAPCF